MKFTGPDNQIIWDAERGKALCRFQGGALETEDERTISILKSLGYESEEKAKDEETESEKPKRGRPKKE